MKYLTISNGLFYTSNPREIKNRDRFVSIYIDDICIIDLDKTREFEKRNNSIDLKDHVLMYELKKHWINNKKTPTIVPIMLSCNSILIWFSFVFIIEIIITQNLNDLTVLFVLFYFVFVNIVLLICSFLILYDNYKKNVRNNGKWINITRGTRGNGAIRYRHYNGRY